MDENKKKLRKMAIWMIAVFAAAFAVVLTVLYLMYLNSGMGGNPLLNAFSSGWWLILLVGVICIAVYFVYKLLLNRKK